MTSESHPELTFALSLIRSEQTFDQPEQSWEFVANMAVSNYVFHKIHVQFEPLQTKIVLRGSNWHGNVYYLSDWGLLVNEFPHQICSTSFSFADTRRVVIGFLRKNVHNTC